MLLNEKTPVPAGTKGLKNSLVPRLHALTTAHRPFSSHYGRGYSGPVARNKGLGALALATAF